MSDLFNPLPEGVDKPALEQALWVVDCFYHGWMKGCSARGMVEQVMGYDTPGESVAFLEKGLLAIWNSLPEIRPSEAQEENYIPVPAGKEAIIYYSLPGVKGRQVHKMLCSGSETEEDICRQWQKRRPLAEIIIVEFREEG